MKGPRTKRTAKISTHADGGPRFQVCIRKTLPSANLIWEEIFWHTCLQSHLEKTLKYIEKTLKKLNFFWKTWKNLKKLEKNWKPWKPWKTLKNLEKPWKTLKKHLKTLENPWNPLKNLENPWKTLKNQFTQAENSQFSLYHLLLITLYIIYFWSSCISVTSDHPVFQLL